MPNFIPSRRRIAVASMLSLTGGLTAVAMFVGLRGIGSRILLGQELPVVIVAITGAFVAGIVFAGAFGRPGRMGWIAAACGAIGATFTGALLGGMLLFGSFDEGIYCVVVVADSIERFPLTGLGWVTLMVMTHILSLVFVPKVPTDLDLIPGPDNL